MSEIVRLAAKGDGVTEDGRYVAGAVPGDRIGEGGSIEPGPHHAAPPCRHFPRCGGCQLQHADEEVLTRFVTDRVINAAASQGLTPRTLLPTFLVPPQTRRRATLHASRQGKRLLLGFKEQRSNRIVDLRECPVLRPELFALVAPLRSLLTDIAGRHPMEIALTLVDQGVDCAIGKIELDGYSAIEAVTDFARSHNLARLSVDQGYGMDAMWEPEPATVTLSGTPVRFPPGGFLQPAIEGEGRLVADALDFAQGDRVADLFAGLGTFAFAFTSEGKAVSAYEASRDAHLAFREAARTNPRLSGEHRDLFRNPLDAKELGVFDTVVLDPPRAGAREQIDQLARSGLERVVYISCNPASWARDAARLAEAGFRLEALRPVGQFRWSTHVELTSVFVR